MDLILQKKIRAKAKFSEHWTPTERGTNKIKSREANYQRYMIRNLFTTEEL